MSNKLDTNNNQNNKHDIKDKLPKVIVGKLVDGSASVSPNKANPKQPNRPQNTSNKANKPLNNQQQKQQPKQQPRQPQQQQAKQVQQQQPKQLQQPRQPQQQQAKQVQQQGNQPKQPKQPQKQGNQSEKQLRIMFLGGVGEIGKNMTVFEYGDSIVLIDAGMSFPTNDMPGVDVVIPDMSYLEANRSKIKGILITHGHEDHVGAVPFLVQKLGGKIDIYGTKLTLGLIENKLVEYNCFKNVNMVTIADKSVVSLGAFVAEFIHVSHSVAGAVAICLRTPAGVVLHTGDFKVDFMPLGNDIMNLNRIAEIGQAGVLLLMSESTNAEKAGYSMSESIVKTTMNKLFSEAKGRRMIIATFASNIDRIGMIIDLAKVYKRRIAVTGRSMISRIETAGRVGYIKFDKDMFVDIDDIGKIDDGKLIILSTGSQGEPMSALTRMANGEFNKVRIGSNDTIVISATPIPGNEKDFYTVVNNLYRLGALVIYSSLADVHVSGHACQEELKLIYSLVKPRYFVPIHGEYRHLRQHAMLIEKLGHKRNSIAIPDIGDCLLVSQNMLKFNGKVASGSLMVDGSGVGDVGNVVLRDRLTLAEDGILVVATSLSKSGVLGALEVTSRGCFYNGSDSLGNTMSELTKLISDELNRCKGAQCNATVVKTAIQRVARQYFRTKFKRNPVILPMVLEGKD